MLSDLEKADRAAARRVFREVYREYPEQQKCRDPYCSHPASIGEDAGGYCYSCDEENRVLAAEFGR